MKAVLALTFEDGSTHKIALIKAIEVDTPGKRELSFRETHKGWVMSFTKSLMAGRKLASENFVTVSKGDLM